MRYQFVIWCDENYLELNVSKRKEMIVDCRLNTGQCVIHGQCVIRGEDVQVVDCYKYLCIWIDCNLKFDTNMKYNVKRGKQDLAAEETELF